MRIQWLSGVVALLAVAGVAAAAVPRGARRLPAPDHVTPETRAALGARMRQHGETMSSLVRSVVLIDRPTIRVLAGRIAEEEVIARSSKTTTEDRRPNLPYEVFAEENILRAAARDLAAAAIDGSDDRILADRFATVSRACVTCHSVYLHGRPGPEPLEPKGK